MTVPLWQVRPRTRLTSTLLRGRLFLLFSTVRPRLFLSFVLPSSELLNIPVRSSTPALLTVVSQTAVQFIRVTRPFTPLIKSGRGFRKLRRPVTVIMTLLAFRKIKLPWRGRRGVTDWWWNRGRLGPSVRLRFFLNRYSLTF